MDMNYRAGFIAIGLMTAIMAVETILFNGLVTWSQIGFLASTAVASLFLAFAGEKFWEHRQQIIRL